MSRYRRANTARATYFFTVVTYRRQRFLCDDDVRDALKHAIQKVRTDHPFTIDAWVLLPDHIHSIWTLPPNDANFAFRCRPFGNAVIGSIKFAMITIMQNIWIICISTRLSMA